MCTLCRSGGVVAMTRAHGVVLRRAEVYGIDELHVLPAKKCWDSERFVGSNQGLSSARPV